MENQSDKTLDEVIVENQRPASSIIPPGQFNFTPVTEMFENSDTELADALATDPDSVARIDYWKADIDKYGINAMSSLGTPYPSFATDTYNPVDQQNPPQNTYTRLENALKVKSLGPAQDPVSPRFSGMRASNFMRYYEHSDFANLGFTPYANMEEYYNANSTIWDDMSRMGGQWTSLAGSGFTSVYRSIGDLFDGDDYWSSPDLKTASEFEDAMAIGNSTRGGGMAWTNNFLLNSAYTFGILGSIAVEELALAGTAALQGFMNPVSDAALVVRTGMNLGRAGHAIKNFFNVSRFASTSRNILNTLKNADSAKDFYTAATTGGRVMGHMFIPNTMYGLKNLKTAQNATQNAINLAKMRVGFGGFYRDLRMVNYAMAESKMESGMVYNRIIRDGVDIYNRNNLSEDGKTLISGGGPVTPAEMKIIQEKASKGAFYTQLANAPIIYASNWFVLGNALGGWNRSLGRMMNDTFRRGIGGRIIKTKATKTAAGKLNRDVFSDAGTGFRGWLKKVRAGKIKGNLGMAAMGTLRYFSANVAEGLQEVSQEAVAAATTGYFHTVMKDPLAGGVELKNQMILSGMGDQLSAEGFSVFMSGFLMGGVVQGPQKLFFQGIPAVYEGAKGKYGSESQQKKYKEYQENKEDLVEKLVKTHNEAWNNQVDDPSSMFDPNKLNFLVQKQVADAMKKSSYDGDMFGFIDAKDFAKFQQMYTIFQSNSSNYFREQLTDYIKLTDEELAEAFPSEAKDIKNGKIRSRLQDLVNQIDKTQDHYRNSKDKFQNPYNREGFKKGTNEYVQEALKEAAYEHARYLYLFTQDGFERALERSNSIYSKLENDPLFEKMAAKDISVLGSIDSINQEIKQLFQEIVITEDADKGIDEANKIKKEKIKRLTALKTILTDPKNLTKKGVFDKRKKGLLSTEFNNYVRYLASTAGSFVDKAAIDTALQDLVDYHALKDRAKVYDKAIEYLSNPDRIEEIAQRQLKLNQAFYKNLKSHFEDSIKKYIDIVEANELMNQLAAIGIYAEPDQTREFLETGNADVLKTFYSEDGIVHPTIHTVRYEQIQRLIGTYKGATQTTTEETTEPKEKKDSEVAEETRIDQEGILGEFDIAVELENTNNTPMLNELLERQYRIYKATAAHLGENVMLFPQWRDSKEGLNFKNTFNNLKKTWVSGVIPTADSKGNPMNIEIPKEDIVLEKGFKEWFSQREVIESAIVKRILDQAGLKLSDIIDRGIEIGEEGEILKGDKNRVVYKRGVLANVVKITTKDQETGENVDIFKLVDNQNKPLSPKLLELISSKFGAFTSAAPAVAALKLIESSAPDSSIFYFDEMELHQGEILFKKDEAGTKYIVLSTPKQVQGGYLRIIEADKNTSNFAERENNVIKLQAGQLQGSYSLQDMKFEMLSSDVTRININEPISPYPFQNEQESREAAINRYNLIISLLSPIELAQLELVATLDENGGTLGPYYAIRGKDGKTYSEPNPYVRTKRSKYQIGIRISDPEVQARVNAELKDVGYDISNSPDNYFAFMPNENFVMYDPQDKEVDPRSMSKEQALNTIYVPENLKKSLTKEQTLKLVQNNFALNANLVSAIDAMDIDKPTSFRLDNLPFKIDFTVSGAVTAYPPAGKQQMRSLNDLMFQHADTEENYLIFDLKRNKGQNSRTIQSITNLEGVEATTLRERVESGLKQQGLWNDMVNGTDRYWAAVLLPNGSYAIVNLKPASFTNENMQDLHVELIERGQLTQKENLDKSKEAKDTGYNTQYNDALKSKLFISTKPGYNVSLQVDPWGKIQLQLFDTINKNQIGDTITINQKIVDDKSLTATQKIQTLIENFNTNTDIKLTGVKLGVSNFRRSFPDTVDVENLIQNTSTAVLPQVVQQQSLRLIGDSAEIQASRDIDSNTDRKVESTTKPEPTFTIAEEAEESILDLSEEEFDVQLEEEFANFEKEFVGHIVNKILRGQELSERETQAYKFLESKINFIVAKKGGPGSITTIDVQEVSTEKVEKTPLSKAKLELDSLKQKLLLGVSGRQRAKTLRESEEYQKILKEVKTLEKEANKILPTELMPEDVEDMGVFMDWAKANLPSFISLDDIATLGNNLKKGGVRVGAFVMQMNNIAGGIKVDGTIYTGAQSPFKYHEAFHGVYRMLLTDEEIVRYRGIARREVRAKLRSEGKTFKTELQRFRNSADTYTYMTEEELKNEYYEEYLADEFQKFKFNPTNTKTDGAVKSLFTRILEWIKSLFSSNSKNELQTLFESIDAGKYKGASLIANEFTSPLQIGVSVEANALIPYASEQQEVSLDEGTKIRTGYLYLDSDIADPLIRSIAAMYLSRTSNVTEAYNPTVVLQELMDDFAWLYSPSNPNNENKSETQKTRLSEIELSFDSYSTEIIDETVKLLNIIGDQINDEEYTVEEFEDATGLRTTSEYDKDASLIGGFNSLSSKLRTYIATTTLTATDYFGNTELVKGEKLIIATDFVEAYNGLLKAVKNIQDPKSILQSMYFFGQDNHQAGAVVNRVLQDVGISEQDLLSNAALSNIQNPGLLQSLIKSLENSRVDYLFNERDEAGNIRIYSASQRDDINSQLDRWNQAWISRRKQLRLNKSKKEQVKVLLEEIESRLSLSKKTLTNQALSNISKDYSERLFDLVGIRLSPLYLQFSMIQNRPQNTQKQKALVRLYAQEEPLVVEDIKNLNLIIQRDDNIFATDDSGMSSRLGVMSVNNAPFDETIGASVFKNPNGDLVYAHQLPTYHLKKIQSLNDLNALEAIKESDPYLKNNILLNSTAFLNMSAEDRIKVIRVAGSKVGKQLSTEEDINESITGITSTQTYGDFSPQEFALSIINNYSAFLNTKSNKVQTIEGRNGPVALAPILIRVMEASNTGDLISLPVIKAIDFIKGESVLTEEAVDIFIDRLRTEFERINREALLEVNNDDKILGYNTKDGRAYKLFNTQLLINDELQYKLEGVAVDEARKGKEISLGAALKLADISMTELRKQVTLNLEIQFDEFQTLLDELNIRDQISNNVSQGPVISAGVQRKELVDSARLLNLNYDETHNLKQIFFNDWINTGSINEILLGDQAISLSGPVDQIKRAKMQNAAYYSAYSAFSAPSLGVHHNVDSISLITLDEVISQSSITGKDIQRADAQMYITTKAFRYMWFGFGKLSPAQAALVTAVEQGQQVTSDEIFGTAENTEGLAKMQAMLNSKKLVYGDGTTFLKMSAFTLTPEWTSIWNEDTKMWIAKPNRVKLHNLRIKLEAIEAEQETLAIAAPLSAIKMKKQRVNNLEQLDNAAPFLQPATILDARFMGLQVINPSNKLEILDPTQIKEIVTSEQKDSVFVESLNMTVGQIRKAYNKAVSRRVKLSYKNKRNLIFTFDTALDEFKVSKKQGAITPNLAAFLNYATEGLKASQASSNLLEFFSSTNGVQNYNLNNPITIRKFEQLFLSYFSKGVLAERAPGLGLTLVSDYGNQIYRRVYEVDENGTPVRSEVIREKVWEKTGNPEDLVALDTLTKNNIPKEGVVVLDRLRHGILENGERHTEIMIPAHFKSVMDLIENGTDNIPEVIAKLFGVRIPSQDNHSAVNIKIVDFMPAYYGSSAMFAQEIIEISGADFDIDKVYALMKEFYVEKGKFIEYGKGNSYDEYIRYINEKTNKSGTVYSEALGLYLNGDLAANISNSLTDSEQDLVTDAGLSENALKALQILGLPITKSQFTKYEDQHGTPFEAPLNNEILDYRYALVGNTGVTESKTGIPISYSPATTEALDIVLAELVELSPEFARRVEEGNIDVDNMVGKIKSFKANKGASIGAIVLPNLYLSLLTEYQIKLYSKNRLNINGKWYGNYGVTMIDKGRKQDILSALITMATDNSKDRLVAKLGLNRHAVGLVANLTALGVPLKTSLLLINNPLIQNDYLLALNKKSKLDPGINKLIDDRISGLKSRNKTKLKLVSVTDTLLLDAINNPENVSDEELYSILNTFSQASTIKDFTTKMGAITSLSKSLGKDIAEVKSKYQSMVELFEDGAPMDLSPIYKGDTWQNQYLQIFTQIHNDLLPATFLTASENFSKILDPVLKSMDTNNTSFTEEVRADIRIDLLSYLTIKAYQKNQLDNDNQKAATLSNKFLYPTDYESINDVVDKLRLTPEGQDNFFLDNFVINQRASDIDNNTGLNLANANTFRKLNASQKVDLQNDFAKLYGSLQTKNDAISILNYIMVKDGMQLAYNSLLEAVSPFIMSSYLDQINSVEKALRDEISFESVFGMELAELQVEFQQGYLSSNINGAKLVTYEIDPMKQLPKEVTWNRKEKTASIAYANTASVKEFIRIAVSSIEGITRFYTFQARDLNQSNNKAIIYDEIEPMGSNQQWAGGFMFGDRSTYKQVRTYVKNNNSGNTVQSANIEQQITNMALDGATIIQEDILKNENAIIIATEKSVDVQFDEEANAINIDNLTGIIDQELSDQESVYETEREANVIEDVDQTMPELNKEEEQLSLDLEFELEDQYDHITEEYDVLIKESANKLILMQNNLFPLSSMIEEYNNRLSKDPTQSSEENQKEFIDNIKNCLLK